MASCRASRSRRSRGHAGQLRLGRVGALPVAVLRGRAHYYECGKADGMRPAIETMAALGCETLVLTNAAGSLRHRHAARRS